MEHLSVALAAPDSIPDSTWCAREASSHHPARAHECQVAARFLEQLRPAPKNCAKKMRHQVEPPSPLTSSTAAYRGKRLWEMVRKMTSTTWIWRWRSTLSWRGLAHHPVHHIVQSVRAHPHGIQRGSAWALLRSPFQKSCCRWRRWRRTSLSPRRRATRT